MVHSGRMIIMTVQFLLLILTIILGYTVATADIRNISEEFDADVSFRCEIGRLPSNAVITWVYRPRTHSKNGLKWLPLYANARRLTQNSRRFVLDHIGYDEQEKKHTSILTINQLTLTDEGIYMCKSNQHQSTAILFNLTVTPSIRVYPNTLIELDRSQQSINLTCIVRELPTKLIEPNRLKWYHHTQGTSHQRYTLFFDQYPEKNQASLVLFVRHLSFNDSGIFKCVYDDSQASKDVRIVFTSVLGYSKSMASMMCVSSSWLWSSSSLIIISFLFLLLDSE